MKLLPELDKYPHHPLNDYQYALLPLHSLVLLLIVYHLDYGMVCRIW